MISRAFFCFAIVLIVSLDSSFAVKGIIKKGLGGLKKGAGATANLITGTDKYNKYDGGCLYADQMYKIHKCVYALKDHMLLSAELASDSTQNVEIIVKLSDEASDRGVDKLKEYGNAGFFRYGEDSRDNHEVLHEGEAHFSPKKCKEGTNVEKLKAFNVVVTPYEKQPICLKCVNESINYYERTNEVLPATAKKCGCKK
ncbi:uncharacterized protein LOC116352328 [Contarinia nasturtii]|uniref:uncharacterized protein LOC116352328 n=1 Tax=Contarinia nasturtii TaxID=265458 RepID=UPI0012D3E5C0|nr:uncharacterized protein LOC116352328 [Contarinia nasturtii]